MSNMSNNLLVCPSKLKLKKMLLHYVNVIQGLKKLLRMAIPTQILYF